MVKSALLGESTQKENRLSNEVTCWGHKLTCTDTKIHMCMQTCTFHTHSPGSPECDSCNERSSWRAYSPPVALPSLWENRVETSYYNHGNKNHSKQSRGRQQRHQQSDNHNGDNSKTLNNEHLRQQEQISCDVIICLSE